jgi:hypothetical protein
VYMLCIAVDRSLLIGLFSVLISPFDRSFRCSQVSFYTSLFGVHRSLSIRLFSVFTGLFLYVSFRCSQVSFYTSLFGVHRSLSIRLFSVLIGHF